MCSFRNSSTTFSVEMSTMLMCLETRSCMLLPRYVVEDFILFVPAERWNSLLTMNPIPQARSARHLREFLAAGASPFAKNKDGKTPLMVFHESSDPSWVCVCRCSASCLLRHRFCGDLLCDDSTCSGHARSAPVSTMVQQSSPTQYDVAHHRRTLAVTASVVHRMPCPKNDLGFRDEREV